MRKIVFISDFFENQVSGGAEIYDGVLIKELSKTHKICKFNSSEFTVKHFNLYKSYGFNFLISNFVGLSEDVKKIMSLDGQYCIIEHDHKYLKNRNPSVFTNFKAPEQMLINVIFYRSAKKVFCQSIKHYEILKNNLNIDNVINLGCSLWSKEQTDIIRNAIVDPNEKNSKAFIINDENPIKGTPKALDFCKSRQIEYSLFDKMEYSQFIERLSEYDKFVFFPNTLETFSRIILEARMLNCKLITNNLNGCTYEEWFKSLKGLELVDFVEKKREEITSLISEELFRQKEVVNGDITVILNCYRRPYNLKMQIEALKNQTVKPKQIWLWINHHEDNVDFDLTDIGVDRIFKNDYNWKFYGRFAAALLADTEYIAIYDDDTVPGNKWHENCLNTMKTHEGILGSAGIILKSDRYIDHDRCGWPTQNKEITEVDLVGHAWFFKREWLRYLWQEKPVTWDNGEDIQFGFMAKVHGGISTYCPPHPPEDRSLHGSVLGNELGIDDKATSTNSAVSHQQFFSERDRCIQEGLKKGWETVKKIKNQQTEKINFEVYNKNFRNDLKTIIKKLENKEPFAFSKYADGEMHILVNQAINNGEFWFIPEKDKISRQKLFESFTFKHDDYYVGISCPCCIGGEPVHKWMKLNSGQKETHLTWANIFVNSNHDYYIKNMIPLYKDYKTIVVSNNKSDISALPFAVKKHFSIGKNAWVDNYDMIEQIKDYIDHNNIESHLFLFCAGPFGNLLSHQLFAHNNKNTYIDIGSTLNVFLLGNKGKNRQYLSGGPDLLKNCIWGNK